MLSLSNLSYDTFAVQRMARELPVLANPKKFVGYASEKNLVEQWAVQGWRECINSPTIGGLGNYIDVRG